MMIILFTLIGIFIISCSFVSGYFYGRNMMIDIYENRPCFFCGRSPNENITLKKLNKMNKTISKELKRRK